MLDGFRRALAAADPSPARDGIVTADGQAPRWSRVDMEATTIRNREPEMPTRIWAEFTDDPMEVLASQLRELGLASGHIGIEMDYLPAGDFELAAQGAARARFERVRGDAGAAAPDQDAGRDRRSCTGFRASPTRRSPMRCRAVNPGDTEMDIAAALTRNVYALGAEQFKLMIVATGERSQLAQCRAERTRAWRQATSAASRSSR
jgi:Xaa-Pro dipeptidase